jgi:hypothetical protein
MFFVNLMKEEGKTMAKKYMRVVFIRLRRRPRACPWMNAQTMNMLRRDVAPKLRRITAS